MVAPPPTQAGGSLLERVAANTGILAAGQILEKVFNFLLAVILATTLGREVFGQYGFLGSFVALFGVLVGLGLTTLCIREISRNTENASGILTSAMVPMALSSGLAYLAIFWIISATKSDQTTVIASAHLAALTLIIDGFANLFETVPRAHERMTFCAVPALTKSAVFFLLCLAHRSGGLTLVGVFGFLVIACAVRLLLQIFFCCFTFRVLPSLRVDLRLSLHLLWEGYPLAITSVFIIVYYKIDSVMLSYMKDDEQVGLYVAATTLAFAFWFLGRAFHQATLPVLSKLVTTSTERLLSTYRLSMKFLAMAAFPLTAGMMLLAPRVTLLVYGQSYSGSSVALAILMLAVMFMFVNGFMGNALIAVGNQKAIMKIVAVSAFVNVGLNLLAIPRFGLEGAAVATVASECYVCLAYWLVLRQKHEINMPVSGFLGPLACCAVMAAYVLVCRDVFLPVLVPSAALLYVASLYFSRSLGTEEVNMIRRLLTRKT